MRNIKFRGKRKDNEAWAYGGFTLDAIGNPRITEVSGGGLIFHEVIPETVGQYIGVNGSENAELYEGDICRAWSEGASGVFCIKWRQEATPCYILYPAYQNGKMWHISASSHVPGKQFISVNGKIETTKKEGHYDDGLVRLGNIHDNPELLK